MYNAFKNKEILIINKSAVQDLFGIFSHKISYDILNILLNKVLNYIILNKVNPAKLNEFYGRTYFMLPIEVIYNVRDFGLCLMFLSHLIKSEKSFEIKTEQILENINEK